MIKQKVYGIALVLLGIFAFFCGYADAGIVLIFMGLARAFIKDDEYDLC